MLIIIKFTDGNSREWNSPEPDDAGHVISEAIRQLTPAERCEIAEIEVGQ